MPRTPPAEASGDPVGDAVADRVADPLGEPGARPVRPVRLPPLLAGSLALHLAALAVAVVDPRQRRRLLLLLVLDHLAISAASLLPRSRLLGPLVTRLAPAATPRVALTFDDGPDPEVTPRVLELLDRHGARASFFLIGERARRHPALAEAIVAAGHRIENHTDRHPHSFAFYGPWRQAREIDAAQRTLTALAGRAPAYMRPPAGIRNPFLDGLLARRGLTLAGWTRRGLDRADGDPRRVARRLVRDLADGDVLLLHDGAPARDRAGEPVSLAALPTLLAAMADAGLVGVPLPEPS